MQTAISTTIFSSLLSQNLPETTIKEQTKKRKEQWTSKSWWTIMDNGKWQKWEREILSQYWREPRSNHINSTEPPKRFRVRWHCELQEVDMMVAVKKGRLDERVFKNLLYLIIFLHYCQSSVFIFWSRSNCRHWDRAAGTEDRGTLPVYLCCVATTPKLRDLEFIDYHDSADWLGCL